MYNGPTMKDLLKQLIQAESTADKGERAAAEVIRTEFERAGIESQVLEQDDLVPVHLLDMVYY